MEKRRWNDDLEVEERKIEDQARQRGAVAVYGICCCQLVYRYCGFPPGDASCQGLDEVSTCADDYLNGTASGLHTLYGF